MRNIFSVFFLALCIMFAYDSNAQMSKKEKKEWKKKIKALKPEQYKTLLDQNQRWPSKNKLKLVAKMENQTYENQFIYLL